MSPGTDTRGRGGRGSTRGRETEWAEICMKIAALGRERGVAIQAGMTQNPSAGLPQGSPRVAVALTDPPVSAQTAAAAAAPMVLLALQDSTISSPWGSVLPGVAQGAHRG